MMAVPNGLDPAVAALTEPMAVALHAVRRGEVGKRDVAIVIGCGPVGLGVILMLKASGVRTVVASDYSAGRRALAERCGADIVIDPSEASPYGRRRATPAGCRACRTALELAARHARETRPPARRLVARLATGGAARPRPEAPGDLRVRRGARRDREIVDSAPLFSRVVVVGVCVGPDTFTPAMAINKEIDLRFVIGYTPLEFRDTLHMLAEGKVDPRPMITGTVGPRRRRRCLRRTSPTPRTTPRS